MNRIAIIGGGAAGMAAAIAAAEYGAYVTIFESNDKLGKKILATGNGRCNLSNINASIEHYHGQNSDFAAHALTEFDVNYTINKFAEMGVLTKVEDKGKIYPYCGNASAVSEALRERIKSLGIEVKYNFEVKDIIKKKDGFMLVSYKNEREKASEVIIATGGKASPASGSKGGGYQLLEKFGHTVTELKPSLVQIKTEPETVKKLKGIKINARVRIGNIYDDGEVLFTDYGLSGPPIFYLSAYIDNQSELSLDFMPEYSNVQIKEILNQKQKNCPDMLLESFMSGIINKKLGQLILKQAGIAPLSRTADSLNASETEKISQIIKCRKFKINGTMSWNNAQVTKGGIKTNEFYADTMQSRLINGIFAAGEILDIDGDCGGYNLQWAWSSGFAAGKSAAKLLQQRKD